MARTRVGPVPRTIRSKLVEAFRALQLERAESKDEILEAYLNAAPYGGAIAGAGAASRAWFGKPPDRLSLGGAALLAGLPQSPTRFKPDTRPERALRRRGVVLARMVELKMITADEARVAAAEPAPVRAAHPPIQAPHAAWLALARRPAGGRTTIDMPIQREVERVARVHAQRLPLGSDLSIVVLDAASGDILGLVGSADPGDPRDGMNNGAVAPRSPGSALKPFIYAAAFETNRLGPSTIVSDNPIRRAGWAPQNFRHDFAGKLSAADALRRSLNIPAILLTEALGVPRVTDILEKSGVRLPAKGTGRSGLALAVGATEVRLLDLTSAYATFARGGLARDARLFVDEDNPAREAIRPEVCAAIDEILSIRNRAPKSMDAAEYASAPWVMWKTGTSSARRDAWALGHNHRYAVGVWVGAFNGSARREFVGEEAAEPILLDLLAARGPLAGEPAQARPSDSPARVPLPVAPYPLVRMPLPAAVAPPRIVFPEQGAVYLADSGAAPLKPQTASADAGLTWFLDGRWIAPAAARELAAPVGDHELRAVDTRGRAHAVRFSVRPFPAKTRPEPMKEIARGERS